MDILIKGLDMPKNGDIFHLAIDSDGNVIKTEGIGFRKYEAIPVPEHDDLVSRKAILSYFKTVYEMGADMDYEDAVAIVSNEKAIPTILEASK